MGCKKRPCGHTEATNDVTPVSRFRFWRCSTGRSSFCSRIPDKLLEVRMESLSPFLQGSFIPYNMPVYPGARRETPVP